MFNLDIIPNANNVDTTTSYAIGTIIAQMVIFYIGIIAFILICMIPPFSLFLPVAIPMIVVIVIFVNFAYFNKFLESSSNQLQDYISTTIIGYVPGSGSNATDDS
jgi:hypothetical protein